LVQKYADCVVGILSDALEGKSAQKFSYRVVTDKEEEINKLILFILSTHD
jgi:hypothetical protein